MGNLGLATSFFNEKNRNLVKVKEIIPVLTHTIRHDLFQDLIEILTEANQELPSWLESIGMDSRFSFGGKKSGGSRSARFGGTGFGAKDVRYENGAGNGKSKSPASGPRPSLGGGGWSGPPGLRADTGGNYSSGAGGPDWW